MFQKIDNKYLFNQAIFTAIFDPSFFACLVKKPVILG